MTPTLQFILFILGFIAVLTAFITFIAVLARRLNGRVSLSRHALIEGAIIAGIIIGIVMMFQQIDLSLFEPGFLLLVFSTLAFIVWSHVTPRARSRQAHSGGPEVAER